MCELFVCENCGVESCSVHHRCGSVERAGCHFRLDDFDADELGIDPEEEFDG